MERASMDNRYLNTVEAAGYLRTSKAFLDKDRLTRLHGVPFVRLGRRVLYDKLALDAFLARQAEPQIAEG
ncbi:MAG: helix-turn-helix domain-containing protein [Thermodesulfobacteriota bacterium]